MKITKLEEAIRLAVNYHAGQKDKSGEPYILHPLRLMLQMKTEEEMIIAVLHDIVEDSEINLQDIEEMFGSKIRDAVDAVTRRKDESYNDLLERVTMNKKAIKIKMKDLEDNINILRLKEVKEKDLQRVKKYHAAWNKLHKSLLST